MTWVEHVEVDDKTQIHRLYRKAICTGFAYGAKRWTSALRRMGERLASSIFPNSPPLDYDGGISTLIFTPKESMFICGKHNLNVLSHIFYNLNFSIVGY